LTGDKRIGWDLGLRIYQRNAGNDEEEYQSTHCIGPNSFEIFGTYFPLGADKPGNIFFPSAAKSF
jgi:hypothetical protein